MLTLEEVPTAGTALHGHMIDDTPHLYYMHVWAIGPATTIAAGLKDALLHVNVKP